MPGLFSFPAGMIVANATAAKGVGVNVLDMWGAFYYHPSPFWLFRPPFFGREFLVGGAEVLVR
jgi:hypothetical protein